MKNRILSEGIQKRIKRRLLIVPPGMDEWEACIDYLLNHTVPKRCPKHQNFLRKYNASLVSEGFKPATRYRHLQILSLFFGFLEKRSKSVRDFSFEDYLDFIAEAKERGVSRGIERYAVAVKKLCKFLERKDLYEKVKIPRPSSRPPEVLTKEEVYRLLEAIGDLEYKTMAAIIYECGLRLREARMLRVKHVVVDEHGFVLRIEESKSQWRILRVIEFKDLLAKWLEVHPDRNNPEAYLFPSKIDVRRLVARNVFYVQLRDAANRIALKKRVYLHLLRHTRATELYQYFKEKEMMYLFGWKTRSMLDVYSHLQPEQIHEKYLSLYGKAEEKHKKPEPQTVKCPKCGFENRAIAVFCARCGRPLKKEYIVDSLKETIEIKNHREELRELKKEFMKLLKQLGRGLTCIKFYIIMQSLDSL